MDFTRASDAEVDRYDVELGAFNNNNTESAWILSNRDCWYPNPYYVGPPVPHPESYAAEYAEDHAAELLELQEQNRQDDEDSVYLADNADQGDCPF